MIEHTNNPKSNSDVSKLIKAGLFWLFLFITCAPDVFAQLTNIKPIERVDPPCWYTDLRRKTLQLLVYGKNIASFDSVSTKDTLIKIDSVRKVSNSNYLFIYLTYGNIQPGLYPFYLRNKKGKVQNFTYSFQKRSRKFNGVQPSDIIYQIFPDRFSSGDSTNDSYKNLSEKTACRDSLNARHGGDFQGIQEHLGYISNLGFSAIWLTPFLINDQTAYSYHGYALTDHYKSDPRFGSNEKFLQLAEECEKNNIKIIMDIVPNHIGNNHWMMKDLPDSDFVHRWPSFTRTNYRASTQMDPYSSEYDKHRFLNGWFDNAMPDVNQRNIHFALYYTQSYLWWVNYAGIDGFRIDTYSYNDYEFMDKCIGFIKYEYPLLYTAGEIWEKGSVMDIAYYTEKNGYRRAPYKSHLVGAIDFQLFWAIMDALKDEPGWDNGLARIYHVLTQDGLYNYPNQNLLFLDNHDLNRYFSEIKNDFNKWKMGLSFIMTLRGVPCIYYGTEHLMTSPIPRTSDGQIRQDFPGGFPGDKINKFDKNQLNLEERKAYDFMAKIIQVRKEHEVFSKGKLMQFIPNGNTYTYFRFDENETMMMVYNRGSKNEKIDLTPFAERINNAKTAVDLMEDKTIELNSSLELEANSFKILWLK